MDERQAKGNIDTDENNFPVYFPFIRPGKRNRFGFRLKKGVYENSANVLEHGRR